MDGLLAYVERIADLGQRAAVLSGHMHRYAKLRVRKDKLALSESHPIEAGPLVSLAVHGS